MNKHIELVKRWLADTDSVTLQELRENRLAASAVADAAADAASAANAAAAAAEVCADAADSQVAAKHKGRVDYWVKQYEKFNKELNK